MELDKNVYNTMVLIGIENMINNNKQEYIKFCFNIYNGCDYFTNLTNKGIETIHITHLNYGNIHKKFLKTVKMETI